MDPCRLDTPGDDRTLMSTWEHELDLVGHRKRKEDMLLGGVWRWVWEESLGRENECEENILYACLKFSVSFC